MRIVCPSCQAAYEVPEKLLSGAPRKVRCARCGGAWTPEPVAAPAPVTDNLPPEEEPPPPEPEPTPEPPPPVRAEPPAPVAVVPRMEDRLAPEPAEPTPGRGAAIAAAVAWVASLALLAGAGWACVTWRAEIMAAWAPSRRVFALLGLE